MSAVGAKKVEGLGIGPRRGDCEGDAHPPPVPHANCSDATRNSRQGSQPWAELPRAHRHCL